jgi:hypothetical protein
MIMQIAGNPAIRGPVDASDPQDGDLQAHPDRG